MTSPGIPSLEEKVNALSQEMAEQSRMLRLHKRTVIYRGIAAGVVIVFYILFPQVFIEYSLKFGSFITDVFIR